MEDKEELVKIDVERFADEEYQKLMADLKFIREEMLRIPLSALTIYTQMYPSAIHRIESGQVNTSVKKLMILLDALGLKLKLEAKEGENHEYMAHLLKELERIRTIENE